MLLVNTLVRSTLNITLIKNRLIDLMIPIHHVVCLMFTYWEHLCSCIQPNNTWSISTCWGHRFHFFRALVDSTYHHHFLVFYFVPYCTHAKILQLLYHAKLSEDMICTIQTKSHRHNDLLYFKACKHDFI